MNYSIIIIGGGASALMLASLLPKQRAIIIENNLKVGAKIAVSGGGKCNVTNTKMGAEYYLGETSFITSVLKKFNEKALLSWLERLNLRPILRKETQYFCQNSSKELLDIFIEQSKKQTLKLNEKVVDIQKREDIFYVKTSKTTYSAKYVVVASGGLSFPKLGATSIGYEIAKSFGHTIVPTAPALVGFTVQKEQFFFKELSGASTPVSIKIDDIVCKGDLLFTHKGISGPCVLDASLFWKKGKIAIDFLGDFSFKNFENSKKLLSSVLPLHKRIIKMFLLQFGVEDKPFNKLTSFELEKLKQLKEYTLAPAGTFGYAKAEVTKGGVESSQIDEKTMMSKREENLYFIGEVLDITGKLGGYNFQWAFSSAFVCSKSLKNKDKN